MKVGPKGLVTKTFLSDLVDAFNNYRNLQINRTRIARKYNFRLEFPAVSRRDLEVTVTPKFEKPRFDNNQGNPEHSSFVRHSRWDSQPREFSRRSKSFTWY